MILNELLLTDIIQVSDTELKYEILDLNSYETFYIYDFIGNPPNYRFIRNIFADNVINPYKNDVGVFKRLIMKSPLFFNAVYLNDKEFLQSPMTVNDIAIIPNVEARGFVRCKEQFIEMVLRLDNLKREF